MQLIELLVKPAFLKYNLPNGEVVGLLVVEVVEVKVLVGPSEVAETLVVECRAVVEVVDKPSVVVLVGGWVVVDLGAVEVSAVVEDDADVGLVEAVGVSAVDVVVTSADVVKYSVEVEKSVIGWVKPLSLMEIYSVVVEKSVIDWVKPLSLMEEYSVEVEKSVIVGEETLSGKARYLAETEKSESGGVDATGKSSGITRSADFCGSLDKIFRPWITAADCNTTSRKERWTVGFILCLWIFNKYDNQVSVKL